MTEHQHAVQPDVARAAARPPEARELTVLEVRFRRGEGCCVDDPVREVVAYYDPDGQLLAEHDDWRGGDLAELRHRWDTDLTDAEHERLAEALRRADFMGWPADQVAVKIAGTVRAIAAERLTRADR